MCLPAAEGRAHALPLQPQQRLPGAGRPVFPEDLAGGLARYAAALQDLAAGYAGQTVLVVSHGEVRDAWWWCLARFMHVAASSV